MKKFNLKKAAQHAYKVCKAREAVIQAAKFHYKNYYSWTSDGRTSLFRAVEALIKLESEVGTTRSHPAERGRSKGAKDGK